MMEYFVSLVNGVDENTAADCGGGTRERIARGDSDDSAAITMVDTDFSVWYKCLIRDAPL
jgi:hypothetical protein